MKRGQKGGLSGSASRPAASSRIVTHDLENDQDRKFRFTDNRVRNLGP